MSLTLAAFAVICRLERRTFSTAEFLSGHPDLQPFTFNLFQSPWNTSVHTVFMEDLGMYCSGCSVGVMLCCMQYTQSQCMEWRERDDSKKTETREHKATQGQSLQTHLVTLQAMYIIIIPPPFGHEIARICYDVIDNNVRL